MNCTQTCLPTALLAASIVGLVGGFGGLAMLKWLATLVDTEPRSRWHLIMRINRIGRFTVYCMAVMVVVALVWGLWR